MRERWRPGNEIFEDGIMQSANSAMISQSLISNMLNWNLQSFLQPHVYRMEEEYCSRL